MPLMLSLLCTVLMAIQVQVAMSLSDIDFWTLNLILSFIAYWEGQ